MPRLIHLLCKLLILKLKIFSAVDRQNNFAYRWLKATVIKKIVLRALGAAAQAPREDSCQATYATSGITGDLVVTSTD